MKERSNKDKQLPRNPYIFVGLEESLRYSLCNPWERMEETEECREKLKGLMALIVERTGYTEDQLRQRKKGRLGLTTARQVFMIIGSEIVMNKSMVGRFVNRSPSSANQAANKTRQCIGQGGHNLLTTVYNEIKSSI